MIFLYVWLCVGVIGNLLHVKKSLDEGFEFRVVDLLFAIVMPITGLIIFLVWLYESYGDKVIIKGRERNGN